VSYCSTCAELERALAEERAKTASWAWIRCADRLPKPGDRVVARSKLEEPRAGWIEVDQGAAGGLALCARHGRVVAFDWFTEWMPLPGGNP